jgi:predicted transcriptional regulator
MAIILTPETETRLRERVEREGQNADALADALLADALADYPDALSDAEATKRQTGIGRGLEAAEAGLVPPHGQTAADIVAHWREQGLIGAWAGREDIKDSSAYARGLRERTQSRFLDTGETESAA